MIFHSLKTQIIFSITGIVILYLALTALFFNQRAISDLSQATEANAINLLEATKNHVESQYNSILYHKSSMLTRRKIELKNNTTIAFAIINSAYQKYKNGKISEKAAKKDAIADLMQLRYDEGVGYFWINNTIRPFPRMIMHPTIPELDGNILDDPKFNCALGKNENLFKAFVDVCLENGEGFVDYLWPKPQPEGLTEQQPKISYVKLFKEWDWIIGTGVYIDDIEKDVQDRLEAVIEDLNKTILKQKIGKSGYFFIFNKDNYMMVHPNRAGTDGNILINPVTSNKILEELKEKVKSPDRFLEYLWDKPGHKGEFRFPKKVFVTYYEPLGWYIGSSVYKEDFEQKVIDLTYTIFIFSGIFIVLALIISLYVSKGITNPINILIRAINKMGIEGIPQETIPETGTTETKLLGTTMNNMIASINKSKKELRKSEAKFRGLIESSSDWIWEVNNKIEFTYSSPQVKDILGYKPEEIIGKTPFDLMAPEEAEPVKSTFNNLIATGKPIITVENINVHKNGQNIVLETSGIPFFDEDEILMGYRGIDRDITERKRAEEAIKIFRSVVEASTDAIGMSTSNGSHYYQNKAFDHLFGNIGSDPPATLYIDESVGREVFQTIMAGKKWIGEVQMHGPDSKILDIFLRAYAIFDKSNQVVNLIGVHTDISEKKQAEEKLKNLQNYLSNIIDSMPSILVGVDAEGKVTQWNKKATHATGIKTEDALGKIISDVFPRMTSEMKQIRDSIKTREVKTNQKKPYPSETGTCYEDITIYPLVANGVEGAVIRIDNITEQVQMEEMMIQSEKMLSVGGLAAGMAHEINNPLAGILQTAEVMSNRLNNLEMNANQKAAVESGTTINAINAFMKRRDIISMLENLRESGKRASEIVTNMLSFSRKSDSSFSSCDLRSLLDQTIDLAGSDYDLKKQYDFRQIKIIKEYEENLPLIQGESSKIQQVIFNILRNGAEAMQAVNEKRKKRKEKALTPCFTFRLSRKNGYIKIEIEDNGPGMDETTRKRIFEPFFTTKPPDQGTGLGLSVSYFIITENHGGKMWVETEKGKGAKFVIKLPEMKQ